MIKLYGLSIYTILYDKSGIWANDGLLPRPSILSITLIALTGAILGSIFMIPLRKSIIVKEHGILPFPEAEACTKVLLTGEQKEKSSNSIYWGMGFGGIIKFVILTKKSKT